MAGSKLTSWLSAQGLVSSSSSRSSADSSASASTPKADKTTSDSPRKPAGDRRRSDRSRSGSDRRSGGGHGRSGGGAGRSGGDRSRGGRSGGGGGGGRRGGPQQFTDHDPHKGRVTAEKREKFHILSRTRPQDVGDIRVVPIGGMEQVGMNMMFIEWGDDIVIIDTGFLFPSPEHYGVDILIPDLTYLIKNKHKIKGIIYTHGHLDHIGGVPYIVPQLGYPPMFSTRLTKELILANSQEFGITKKLKITEIDPTSKIKLGKFNMEFFHINHSIPGGVGIVANTPYGKIVNTSDFKIDHNPSDDQPADLTRIGQLGREGVALAMVDSTNAMKPGHTISESIVEANLAKLVHKTKGRLIIATFASSVGRVSKIVEAAEAAGRTVFLSGRSMEKNIGIARKLNYLKCKERTIQRISKKADTMDPSRVLILSTGSQGEELAALTRMAAGRHAQVRLRRDDTIVFSSSPIPGNEIAIVSVRNNLAEIGVHVIDHLADNIYVSGHGYAEECKLMTSLLNPRYFAPIHGELYMRNGHRDLVVRDLGYNPKSCFVMRNGRGVVLSAKGARLMTEREAIKSEMQLIENGHAIKESTLTDRHLMSEGGLILVHLRTGGSSVKKVNIRARGFRADLSHEIFKQIEKEAKSLYERNASPERAPKALETMIQKAIGKILYQKFKKDSLVEVVISA